MTQYNRNTLIISIAILLITSIGAYKAFIYGFNWGAVKYAPIIQKDTTALVCGLRYTEPMRCELEYIKHNSINQAYEDSSYFLQSTFNPMSIKLEETLISIQKLIKSVNFKSKLPEWVK